MLNEGVRSSEGLGVKTFSCRGIVEWLRARERLEAREAGLGGLGIWRNTLSCSGLLSILTFILHPLAGLK
jgi:hypothetical protein